MTHAVQQRIARLMDSVNEWPHRIDLLQLEELLIDLADTAESVERERVRTLIEQADRRLYGQKGRGWSTVLAELDRDVEIGTQLLPFDDYLVPDTEVV